MASTTLPASPPAVDVDDTELAIRALDATIAAATATRDLLRARRRPATDAARWISLAAVQVLLGAPSLRAASDALDRLGVAVVRAGRARVVARADLDAALAAAARPPRAARRAPVPSEVADDDDQILARAGLKLAGGVRR